MPMIKPNDSINNDPQIKSNHEHLRGIVLRLIAEYSALALDLMVNATLDNGGSLLAVNAMLENQRRALLEQIKKLKQQQTTG